MDKNNKRYNQVKNFKKYRDEGLGTEYLTEAAYYLDACGDVIEDVIAYADDQEISIGELEQYIYSACEQYNKAYIEIRNYQNNPALDVDKNNITGKASNLYSQVITVQAASNYTGFFSIANHQKWKRSDAGKIKDALKKLDDYEKEANSTLDRIKNRDREAFAHDYANIFRLEAEKFSRRRIKPVNDNNKKFKKWGIGRAEWFFLLGIALIGYLVKLILNDFFIPTESDINTSVELLKGLNIDEVGYAELLIPFYIKKIFFVLIIVFGIKFSFKQYSICSHLYTINKHRANTLDSFEFFYDNLKSGDASLREQYLIEVAKSVFNTTDSGYINPVSGSSLSIVDNFNFLKDKANK